MSMRRRGDEASERVARRRLARFRTMLALSWLVLWIAFLAVVWSESWPRPGSPRASVPLGRAGMSAASIAAIPVLHLFCLLVAGVLHRLRLRVWIVCVAAAIAGPALGGAFLWLALHLAAGALGHR